MTNALENSLIDFLFRGVPYMPPQALYIGLFVTTPTDAEPGLEPAAPSYRRGGIACTMDDWSGTNAPDWSEISTGTSGISYSMTEISFPDPQEDWGSVAHVGVFDAAVGGNYLFWGELLHPRDFVVGDTNIKFNPGEISFQIDN